MNVGMRHINAYNSHAHLDAGADLLESFGYTAREAVEIDKKFIVKVKNIVHLFLGYAEDMTLDNRVDIENGEKIVGLGNLIAGYLTCHYA
jgi:hypothetical protein